MSPVIVAGTPDLELSGTGNEIMTAHLQATLARAEHALGVLTEAIVWTDGSGNVRWCNPAFARLSLRPAMSAIGRPIDQILALTPYGESNETVQHPVCRVLASEGGASSRTVIENYVTERSGDVRYLEVYATCLVSAEETSAIMVIRDNTERHLAERWLEAESRRADLVRAVAAASNQAEDPQFALEACVKLILRFLGWPLGHAMLVEPGTGSDDDESGEFWFPESAGELAAFTGQPVPAGGRLGGLPAEVIKSGQAIWVPDITLEPGCPRAGYAASAGLKAAIAFPVKALNETKAVLEFFTTRAAEPDGELMPLFDQIGAQLGRVFERQQSSLGLVRAKLELEQRVAERTRELTTLNASLELEIASRERFQSALREAMDRYQSLMQSVRDIIFGISNCGRVESLNSAFDVLTGLSWRDQVMERVVRLIHPEDRRGAARAFRRTLAGDRVAPFEIRIRHSSGDWIFLECSLTLQTKAGHATSVAGIARDVTESRRAKAELIVRDRAMAATSEGIVITNPRLPGNPITFVNSGFERLTGYASAEAIGKSLEPLLHGPETAPETTRRLEQAAEECQPVTVELLAYRRDGQTLWTRLVITPVRDEQQRPANFVAILSDISTQKEAERMKNEFVSTVSHELRTPLTSLRGFAELMLEREYPPEKQRKFVQIIHRESTRLGDLINDFLDVQRMEAGCQHYRFARVALGQILSDSAALFRPTSPIHRFDVECEADLPDARADVDRLRQITTNLLSNAVKFSPKGGLVRLSARREDGMVLVSICDSGIGIPPDAIGKLFGKFYRVDNTETRKIGGTGLGLSIVKQIVDAHGGRVWVESRLGEGTCVLFTVPVFA